MSGQGNHVHLGGSRRISFHMFGIACNVLLLVMLAGQDADESAERGREQ